MLYLIRDLVTQDQPGKTFICQLALLLAAQGLMHLLGAE